jgi:hypothetical protein
MITQVCTLWTFFAVSGIQNYDTIRGKSMPPLLEGNTQANIHWARKYSAEIGVGLFVLAIIFIGLGLHSLGDKPKPVASETPQSPQPVQPAPVPQTQRKPKHTIAHPVQTASAATTQRLPAPQPQKRIIEQPKIQDIPFSSSTKLNIQGLLQVSVSQIREVNGMTAITFKVDGSMNSQQGIGLMKITAGSGEGNMTNVIDSNGRRYRLLNGNPDGRLSYVTGIGPDVYRLEPHETVYPTYLFENIDHNASSLDIHFISFGYLFGYDIPPIHVVM